MRLTTFTDYSLRVLMYLAVEPQRRATIREIAHAFHISENHLMKVVHFLGTVHFLTNVRGKGGGLELAREPARINLGDVVRLTESKLLPAECFDEEHNTCTIVAVCQLRDVLGEAAREFYRVLDRYTLEDVVRNRPALSRVFWMRSVAGGGPGAASLGSGASRAPSAKAAKRTPRSAEERSAGATSPAARRAPARTRVSARGGTAAPVATASATPRRATAGTAASATPRRTTAGTATSTAPRRTAAGAPPSSARRPAKRRS